MPKVKNQILNWRIRIDAILQHVFRTFTLVHYTGIVQAPTPAVGRGPPRPRLHPDDQDARRAGGLPQLPRLRVPPAGRVDQGGDEAGAHGKVQQQQVRFFFDKISPQLLELYGVFFLECDPMHKCGSGKTNSLPLMM